MFGTRGETTAPVGRSLGDAVTLMDVTMNYGTKYAVVHAVRQVALGFGRGSMTAVMGPSGSGKTTLLHCAAGLIRPSAGQVFIGETDISRLDEDSLARLRRSRISMVFQAYNLLPALTAEQNVMLPLRLAGHKPPSSQVIDALRQVGLADRAKHRPGQLSGGQQQRVAIARALITNPEVLFADEPTGALDVHNGREVLSALRHLVDVRGQTVIMATHDPMAAACADRVVFLSDGVVVAEQRQPTPESVAAKLAALGG
ncbi:ABC transporter ATP-binding protein [Lentzea sp. NBRC 102530]|uniref:ABC transporter ATP-binding protein n=1 Tax=Lentzea sp. NBRC 102530 TaxID=3032201 RepID=UPI0024A08555|nr:ABC transporter ATP-binding protein [Lentzea sp. NBRC 102530]